MAYALLVIALLLNACANTLLKTGAARFGDSAEAGLVTRVLENPHLLLGLLLFVVNVGCYAAALVQLKLSVAYPVMAAGSLLLVVLSSAFWLGEAVTIVQWSGIALLLIGMVLVTWRSAA